jgi:hypothetical protein
VSGSSALIEMAEVVTDFHAELNDVLSKVNSWSLSKEKDLMSVQAEHTSFLDTHNGRHAYCSKTCLACGPCMLMSASLCHPDVTMQLKRREREAKAKIDKLMQGLRGIFFILCYRQHKKYCEW